MTVIDWDKSDILNYLGTYFPRSYAEAYCIFSHYFTVHPDAFSGRDTLSVFDFGCGTGGEIIGLLTAVKKCFHNIKHIEVSGLDGNHHALRLLENIVERYSRTEGVDVRIKVMPAFHYNLTANYIYNKSTVEEGIVVREYTRPLHWFFSLSGGVAYRIE